MIGIVGSLLGVILGTAGQYLSTNRSRRWQVADREYAESIARFTDRHRRAREAAEAILAAFLVDNPLWISQSTDDDYSQNMRAIASAIGRESLHLPDTQLRSRLTQTQVMLELSSNLINIRGYGMRAVWHTVLNDCRLSLGAWLRDDAVPQPAGRWNELNAGLTEAIIQWRARQENLGHNLAPMDAEGQFE